MKSALQTDTEHHSHSAKFPLVHNKRSSRNLTKVKILCIQTSHNWDLDSNLNQERTFIYIGSGFESELRNKILLTTVHTVYDPEKRHCCN